MQVFQAQHHSTGKVASSLRTGHSRVGGGRISAYQWDDLFLIFFSNLQMQELFAAQAHKVAPHIAMSESVLKRTR